VTDVFVVEINVDKVAQHVLIVEEMAAQAGVCRGEQIKRLTGGICFDCELRLSPANCLSGAGIVIVIGIFDPLTF
jgi:hypothetical protein